MLSTWSQNLPQRCWNHHLCESETGLGVQDPQPPVLPDTPRTVVWPLGMNPGIPSAARTPGWRWPAPLPHSHTPAGAATPAAQEHKVKDLWWTTWSFWLYKTKNFYFTSPKSLNTSRPDCCASSPWGWSVRESWHRRFRAERPSWTAATLRQGHYCSLSAVRVENSFLF